MKPIIVVGSINMDLVTRTGRIPRPGETVLGSGFQMHSGGKGANQAVAVARLGYPSILLGVLGSDVFSRQLISTLNEYGVNAEHVGSANGSSGTASIVVDENGENTIIVTPGANLEVTPDFLESKLDVLRSAGMVLAQLEIPVETVEWLADRCVKFKIPFMLDPAPAIELPAELLSHVTWFTPNQTESVFYAESEHSEEDTVRRLLASGIANIVLKRGRDGAIAALSDGARYRVEAFRVNPVDTTAAGDSFNGAFAVGLMRGFGVEEALRFAAAAAAISVTRHGAQPSMPSLDAVSELLTSRRCEGRPIQ
jgi:ribokinase